MKLDYRSFQTTVQIVLLQFDELPGVGREATQQSGRR